MSAGTAPLFGRMSVTVPVKRTVPADEPIVFSGFVGVFFILSVNKLPQEKSRKIAELITINKKMKPLILHVFVFI